MKFADVSAELPHKTMVGSSYVFKVPMHISGVNLPPGYRKIVDVYVVNPASPSFGGPEVVTRETLPPGTRITVKSVERCTNCFLTPGDYLQARIEIAGYRSTGGLPITMNLYFFTPEVVDMAR